MSDSDREDFVEEGEPEADEQPKADEKGKEKKKKNSWTRGAKSSVEGRVNQFAGIMEKRGASMWCKYACCCECGYAAWHGMFQVL